MDVFTFNKDYGRDLPKYLFMPSLSFSYVNGFLLQGSSPQVKLYSSSFASLFTEALNPAALKRHTSPLLFLPRDDNSQRPRGYNYSSPSFHWIEHLPYGSWTVWKKQEESQKSVTNHCLWKKERSSRKKDLSEDKMKDSSEEMYLSRCQKLVYEMEGRCFVRQAIWSHEATA